jgi:hypothetical protein
MKNRFASAVLALNIFIAAFGVSGPAQAHNDASALSAISALPVASVVVGGSAVAGSVAAVPVVLSTAGAVLVVKTVESTARSTLLVLERMSDGAQVSLELLGTGIGAASLVVGTSVTVSVIGAGVVLSAAGESIAFVPNALGNALLHSERLTN